MKELRFAILGTGFWSQFQLTAWQEVAGTECVAIYNRTRDKAEALANQYGVPQVYDNVERMFRDEELDFVDIITDVATHRPFVLLAAQHKVSAICQKPLADSLEAAQQMAETCSAAGTRLFVHENWRWQTPLRAFKQVLESGRIGEVFRARIQYSNSFPVFDNQPFLKQLRKFILTDIGTHILDVARFLFGESQRLYCQTSRVHDDIRGEDVATVMLQMQSGATVTCEMSYASRLEHDRFPETFVLAEGTSGSLELAPDYWVRLTTAEGTYATRHAPPHYAWADSAYDLIHASIVPCHENLLAGLRGDERAETTAADNLKTLRLVYSAYQSAESGQAIELPAADGTEE